MAKKAVKKTPAPAPVVSDPQIATLEAKVKELEARLSDYENESADELCKLNYWIRTGTMINPCPILYPRAGHLDGSHWVIKRSLFPHAAFARMQAEAGGVRNMRFWLDPVHPRARQATLEQAAYAMRLRLNEAVVGLNKSIATANEKINAADAEGRYKDRDKQIAIRTNAVNRCRELLVNLEKVAKEYKLDKTGMNHVGIFNYTVALENAQYQQTRDIAALADACIGTELEGAASRDEVPAAILADFVEERGGNVDAARIALGQVPQTNGTPTPTPAPVAEQLVEVTFGRMSNNRWGVWVQSIHHPQRDMEVIAVRGNGGRQRVRLTRLSRRSLDRTTELWSFAAVDGPTEQPAAPAATTPPPAAPEVVAPPQVTTAKLTRTLANGVVWTLTYNINCTRATIVRSRNDEEVETMEMSREDARRHYAAQLETGYTASK